MRACVILLLVLCLAMGFFSESGTLFQISSLMDKWEQNTETSPGVMTMPTGNAVKEQNRFAYAFCLFSVSSKNDGVGYKPFLANVLVAAELFHRYGISDNVDIVLFVAMQETNDALLEDDARLLQYSNVKLKYYDPIISSDATDSKKGFMEATMNKAIILNATEYTRVLHLDCDVIPLASIEYIFDLSMKGIFKENMIIATMALPMNAGFFMVTPSEEGFQQALDLIDGLQQYAKDHPGRFDSVHGWGGINYFASDETPPALRSQPTNNEFRAFDYYGGNGDQGLFYIWPRFVRKSMTHMLHDRFVNYGPGGPNNTLSLIESVHYYPQKGHVNPFLEAHIQNAHNNATSSIKASNCYRYDACGVPNPYWHHMHFLDQEQGRETAKPHRYFMTGTKLGEYHALQANKRKNDSGALRAHFTQPILMWWDALMELEERWQFNYTQLWLPNATTFKK